MNEDFFSTPTATTTPASGGDFFGATSSTPAVTTANTPTSNTTTATPSIFTDVKSALSSIEGKIGSFLTPGPTPGNQPVAVTTPAVTTPKTTSTSDFFASTVPGAASVQKAVNSLTGKIPTTSMEFPVGENLTPQQTTQAQNTLQNTETAPQAGTTIKLPFVNAGFTVPGGDDTGSAGNSLPGGILKSLVEFPEKALRSPLDALGLEQNSDQRPSQYVAPSYAEMAGKNTAQILDQLESQGYDVNAAKPAAAILGAAGAAGQFSNDALAYIGLLESGAAKVASSVSGDITSNELKTAHEFLGSPTTMEEARQNYLNIQKEFHPDKTGGDDTISKQANNAWQILQKEGIPTGSSVSGVDRRPQKAPTKIGVDPQDLQNIADEIKATPKDNTTLASVKSTDLTPQSDNIKPDSAFRALDIGKLEGTPENSATLATYKANITKGDIPVGPNGTGETFNQFQDRVLPEFNKILNNAKDGTTIVTHNTVLKLMQEWDKEGRPSSFQIDPKKYNTESTNTGDVEQFKGKNGTINVVRHGETEDNTAGNFRSANTNLTDTGVQQAQQAALELKDNLGGTPPQIITSDLPRAIHTSNILMKGGEGISTIAPEIDRLNISDEQKNALQAIQEGDTTPKTIDIANTIPDSELDKLKSNNLDTYHKLIDTMGNGKSINGKPNIGSISKDSAGKKSGVQRSTTGVSTNGEPSVERPDAFNQSRDNFLHRISTEFPENTISESELIDQKNKLEATATSGDVIPLDKNIPITLTGLGFPEGITSNILSYKDRGAFETISYTDPKDGKRDAGGYNPTTKNIMLNPLLLDHPTYLDGSIFDHEAGHALLDNMPRARKADVHIRLEATDIPKQVWNISKLHTYNSYYKMTSVQIRGAIYNALMDDSSAIPTEDLKALATEIMKRAGFDENKVLTLNEFTNETKIGISQKIDAINKILTDNHRSTISIRPEDTMAAHENFAMMVEFAKELKSDDPVLQDIIAGTVNKTIQFGGEKGSDNMFSRLNEEDTRTPQEIMADAIEKANGPKQSDRINELDTIVSSSPDHDDFIKNLSSNELLKDTLPKLNTEVQDMGYVNLTDYYVKNKITSNIEKGIVPQRTYAKPKEAVKTVAMEPKREIDTNPKERLDAYKYIKDEMRGRINQHPGKILQKYQSLKEGDFEDFKNPDLAKTPSERKAIIERNNKVIEASERAMDIDPRLSGMHDNPDVIREQIAEYNDLKQQLANVVAEEKAFRADIAKGKAEAQAKQIAEIRAKAKKFDFTVPELDDNQSIDMLDIIAQNELIKNHPAKPFIRYVNNRTGLLPEIQKETPGIYGTKMANLLDKNGLQTVKQAQALVDNYRAHNELLTEMYVQRFDPLELAQANSVHRTPNWESEQERLASKDPLDAKPLDTIVEQDSKIKVGNDVKKKVGAHDYLRTPDRVLTKIGLGDEAKLIAKQYDTYLKELPKNIDRISQWAKRVPGKDSSRKIFDYLDGKLVDENGFLNPDVLTKEELAVGNEIRSWLDDWAFRLNLKQHERIANYITHIFDNDLKNKEFDVDLAKIIDKKVAGEVYDPFLQERLGALGYRRDAWSALDAYVKRATRKVNMDVALAQVKIAAEALDIASFNYVKSYVDRINLRPTATDTLIDNSIKQLIGYRLGARPLSRITSMTRKWAFRGTLGLNASSALRNLVQGANTYAILGTKYTSIGYTKLLSKENQAELSRENILTGSGQIQDRILSSTKKFWSTIDKGMFSLFQTAENINRGSAYFGAKAKYYAENSRQVVTEVNGVKKPVRVFQDGASEEKAIQYAKDFTKKIQFSFSAVDTPVMLQSDLAKTLLQFQSFNLKQAEFLAGMMKDKNYMGLLRFAFASIAFLLAVGSLFGMKWQDLIPFYSSVTGSYNPPPLIAAPLGLIKAALATNNQYGQPMTRAERLTTAIGALTPLIPFGTQGKKTISGIQAIQGQQAPSLVDKARALFFGSTVLPSSAATTKLNKDLKTYQTKISKLDPAEVATVQPIFLEAKTAGFGTPAADALVQGLTNSQYKVYQALKVQDNYQSALALEGKVTPIVRQAAQLGFGTDAANKLVNDSFPNTPEGNAEYDAYTKIKTAMYGTAANPTAAATINADTSTSSTDNATLPRTPGPGTSTWSKQNLIQHIVNISKAIGTDPVTTFKDIMGGDYQITGLANGQVIVNRNSAKEATEKKALGGGSTMTLDHLESLELGGTNQTSNMWLVEKNQAAIDDQVENYLADALNSGKITGKQAQTYELQYKKGADAAFIDARTKKLFDGVGNPMTFDQIKQEVGN